MSIDPGPDPKNEQASAGSVEPFADPIQAPIQDPTLVVPMPESPDLTAEPAKGSSRRLLAAGVVVVVVVAALGFFYLRGSNGTALALAFSPGQTTRYHMTLGMDSTMGVGGQSVPLKFTSDANVAWHVTSVDPAGTATVQVTVSNMSVSSNGQNVQVPDPPATTIHVTSDGQVLSSSGLTISSGSGQLPGVNGTDQLSTILPNYPVKPGDTWSKSATRTLFGSTISYRASGTYLRDENVGSTGAAVIQTKVILPMDLTLTGADFASLIPSLANAIPADASIAYIGESSVTATSWIDPVAKRLLRTRADSAFSIDMKISGVPGAEKVGNLHMSGTASTSLQQV